MPLLTLRATDRCDRCRAQALVVAFRAGTRLELLFCGHHGREHAPALLEQGWTLDSPVLDR